MEEQDSNKENENNSGGGFFIFVSLVLFCFLFYIFDSGNISIKGIESSVESEPFAFYTTMSILFFMCFCIFLFGISEALKSKKRKEVSDKDE